MNGHTDELVNAQMRKNGRMHRGKTGHRNE